MTNRPSPTLSVIICNYNHARLVSTAIEAVLAQSRRPDEFIILDDASTDDSAAVIRRYAEAHSWIRFIQNERNLGALGSCTRAVGLATGTYVYFGAADDYVLPGFFENAMTLAARHPDAGSIVGTCVMAEPNGKEVGLLTAPGWPDMAYIAPADFLSGYLRTASPTHSFVASVIFRRACFDAAGGFRPELGFWVDTFLFRVIGLRHGVCHLAQHCARWHIMPDSLCHGTTRHPKKELVVLDRLVALMTSEEFRRDFPADYVDQWAATYRREIIERAVARVDRVSYELSTELWPNIWRRSWPERAVKAVLTRFDRGYRVLLRLFLRYSLRRYNRRTARPDA